MTIVVQHEELHHAPRVRLLNELAFEQPAEANLVDALRRTCADKLSLVAVDEDAVDEEVVGHILFTPVEVESNGRRVVGMGLAPMAVVPERQRQGIGSLLVRRGLDILRERGCPFVVVVGHQDFYPRFGFERASTHGLTSQWEGIADASYMAIVLDAPAMAGVSGVARYRDEFNEFA
jgi:putative acetyltransferase